MKVTPPRPALGRKLTLIGITALLLTPTMSIGGNQNRELRENLRTTATIYGQAVRAIQTDLRENLRTIPRRQPVGSFDSTLQLLGNWGYQAWYDEKEAYYDGIQAVRQQFQNTTLDLMDPGVLLGRGSCADRFREQYLWEERVGFAKWLESTLRGTRWELEEFDSQSNRFERIPVDMSVIVYPNPRDLIIFTPPPVKGPSSRVKIAGIVGASYMGIAQTQTTASACVFGTSAASSTVDVTADGPGGSFNAQTTSDTDGRWDVCIQGLRAGYYQFLATEGSNSSALREMAFQLRVNF